MNERAHIGERYLFRAQQGAILLRQAIYVITNKLLSGPRLAPLPEDRAITLVASLQTSSPAVLPFPRPCHAADSALKSGPAP